MWVGGWEGLKCGTCRKEKGQKGGRGRGPMCGWEGEGLKCGWGREDLSLDGEWLKCGEDGVGYL